MDSVKRLAISLMGKHGLIQKGWAFDFDKAKRRAGACYYNQKKISLSLPLAKVRSKEMTKNTILHEIAHAVVGPGHGHNHVWKRKAIEIGCDGKRCFSDAKIIGKWQATCAHGKTYSRHRRPTGNASCSCEGKKFNPKSILVWKECTS